MPRIPFPDPDTLPEADRELLASLPQLNISRLLAASPSMFRPITRVFNAYLNDGVLDVELREIIILRTGHLRKSEYEVVHHKRAARLIGMSDERIEALAPGNDLSVFSAAERKVIRFVDEVVMDGAPSQATFDAVAAFMNPAELVEITVVIGVYTLVSQVCSTFEIELEDMPIAESGIEDIGRAVDKL